MPADSWIMTEPIEREVFDAARLMAEHPPVLRDPNKRAVYDVACPAGAEHGGTVTYTRWRAMPLPGAWSPPRALAIQELREDVYDYEGVLGADAVEWHVNFADPHLFVACSGPLFAQDEMQVAEHPVLGALKQALVAGGHGTLTVERGEPTPILVAGAERRCRVRTDADAAAGRPRGLYGNAFSAAPVEAVRRATEPIDPPTVTNLVAIAAPAYGVGRYTEAGIAGILRTAFTGFRAAVLESGGRDVAIHTGFWGCGAFGGNRVLMSLLQLLAAEAAGAARLVFHGVSAAGAAPYRQALQLLESAFGARDIDTDHLVRTVVALGLEWGESDGN